MPLAITIVMIIITVWTYQNTSAFGAAIHGFRVKMEDRMYALNVIRRCGISRRRKNEIRI